METVDKYIMVTLSEEEYTERSRKLASLIREQAELEAQKKSSAAYYKEQLDGVQNKIDDLIPIIESGMEERLVTCEILWNHPNAGVKTYRRIDTGEEVRTVNMTDSECSDMFRNQNCTEGTEDNAETPLEAASPKLLPMPTAESASEDALEAGSKENPIIMDENGFESEVGKWYTGGGILCKCVGVKDGGYISVCKECALYDTDFCDAAESCIDRVFLTPDAIEEICEETEAAETAEVIPLNDDRNETPLPGQLYSYRGKEYEFVPDTEGTFCANCDLQETPVCDSFPTNECMGCFMKSARQTLEDMEALEKKTKELESHLGTCAGCGNANVPVYHLSGGVAKCWHCIDKKNLEYMIKLKNGLAEGRVLFRAQFGYGVLQEDADLTCFRFNFQSGSWGTPIYKRGDYKVDGTEAQIFFAYLIAANAREG